MKALPDLLERTGADLVITPCLLGGIFKATGNRAPMLQYADVPAKLAYENLEMRRFIERHGLTRFRLNPHRSEEHTSELQSLMRISYAVFCLNKKNTTTNT